MMRAILSLLMIAIATGAAAAYPAPYTCTRNFFVSTTGADTATCGTAGAPCATIQGANNATSIGGTGLTLHAGDCVNLAAGTYSSASTINLTKGGSSNQATGYVTYIGAPNHGSVITWTGTPFNGLTFSTAYLILDGIDFNGNLVPAAAILASSVDGANVNTPVHHLMLLNNIIRNAKGAGFVTADGDYFIIAGNIIHDTSQCISYGQSAVHILWPNALPGFTSTLPWDTQYYHIQYIDNISHDNGRNNYPACGTNNDQNGLNADNFQLSNWPTSPGSPPNPGEFPYHTLFAGNVVYNNGSRGINANSAHNIDFYNNTSYNNGLNTDTRPGGASGGGGGTSFSGDCEFLANGDGNNFANNILIANSASPENGKTLCWYSAYGYPETNYKIFNNDFYNGSANSGVIVNGTRNDSGNLASITAASANNKLAVNPLLTNLVTPDFHPQPGSPVLGAGATLVATPLNGPIQTNDGQVFTSPPPMGAFNSSSPAPTSVAGPVSISAGGSAAPPYIADAGFTGGTTACGTFTTDTSLITTTPAPQAVYNCQRYGPSFSYAVSSLTPGNNYTVILHFTEDVDTATGQRQENVTINGTQVLTGLDIFSIAGAQHKAIERSFLLAADPTGSITISFAAVTGLADPNAKVDAIQVLAPPTAANQTASTPFQTPVTINLANGSTGRPVSAAVSGTPAGGAVAISGLNATFTPNSGFSGNASFQFTLSGDGGTSNPATVSITVGQSVSAGGPQPGHLSPPYNCLRTFYVSTSGSDTNACSSSAPCASIQGAHNNISLQGGDCVNVAAGTYNTSSAINLIKGGNANTATGYVTYIGAPNRGSIINFNATIANALTVSGSYMILDGFEFAGNSVVTGQAISGGPCQTLSGQVHHVMVLNSSIHDFGGAGIAFQGGDYYTFAGNLIYNNAWHSASGDQGLSIFEPAAIPGFASTLPLDTQTYHIQILENVSHNNGCLRGDSNCLHGQGDGFGLNDFYGVQWQTGSNAATWPGAYHSRSLVAGNLAYANGGRGFEIAPNTNVVDVFNNTSYGDGADPTGSNDEFILVGSNNNIYDNIFWDTAGGNAINFNNTGTASPDTGNTFAYNLTFNGTVGQQSVSVTNTSNNSGYLSQITGSSAHNQLGVAPALTSVATPDFRPLAGSPVLGAGGGSVAAGYIVLTVDGLAFGSPDDIGGYHTNQAIASLPPCTTTTECFQYIPGWWFVPDGIFTSNGATSPPGANIIRCIPAGMRSKATISQLASRVYRTDASGHVQFSIYTNGSNSRPATNVAISSSAPVSSAGPVITALQANIQGGPGGAGFSDSFWLCANTDSNMATFGSTNSIGAIGPSVLGSATLGNVLQQSGSGAVITSLRCSGSACAGGSSAFGNFPASLAGTTWTEETANKMPAAAMQITSVP